ncbi:dethiobiotin synthase [Gordonia sp. VNK21]|uniref:dethiobiotin synthase n=1 Tax=Gordonia sp. VNK21 TaxID=3382483 RepID=UPI0038D42744
MSARRPGSVVVITGTSTDVGKTVATAALAAAARSRGAAVAVVKPAQTGVAPGEPGDLAQVRRLAGEITTVELIRYREPLAPETAARRSGDRVLTLAEITAAVERLRADHDLVLIEGAGGVLVRLAPDLTICEPARALGAPVLVVADPGLGSLNHTELTVRALRTAGCRPAGLVIGRWPDVPDLATACNRDDLPRLTGVPVLAALPDGCGAAEPAAFRAAAPHWWRPETGRLLGDRDSEAPPPPELSAPPIDPAETARNPQEIPT